MAQDGPNAPVQVTVDGCRFMPPTSFVVYGRIDGRYFEAQADADTWRNLPNIGAKRQYAAQIVYNMMVARDALTEPGLPGVIVITPQGGKSVP
jgi:hypothetical protein